MGVLCAIRWDQTRCLPVSRASGCVRSIHVRRLSRSSGTVVHVTLTIYSQSPKPRERVGIAHPKPYVGPVIPWSIVCYNGSTPLDLDGFNTLGFECPYDILDRAPTGDRNRTLKDIPNFSFTRCYIANTNFHAIITMRGIFVFQTPSILCNEDHVDLPSTQCYLFGMEPHHVTRLSADLTLSIDQ